MEENRDSKYFVDAIFTAKYYWILRRHELRKFSHSELVCTFLDDSIMDNTFHNIGKERQGKWIRSIKFHHIHNNWYA